MISPLLDLHLDGGLPTLPGDFLLSTPSIVYTYLSSFRSGNVPSTVTWLVSLSVLFLVPSKAEAGSMHLLVVQSCQRRRIFNTFFSLSSFLLVCFQLEG